VGTQSRSGLLDVQTLVPQFFGCPYRSLASAPNTLLVLCAKQMIKAQ